MERLTDKAWRNLDPWECCGQDKYCGRGCHDLGGCTGGCIVPKLYAQLGKYEDTGMSPEEITSTDKFLKENYSIPLKRLVEAYELLMAKDRGEIAVFSPHTPLTREELREMDGKPVHVCWAGHADVCWALVKVFSKKYDVICLTYPSGKYDFLEDLLDKGAKIYAAGWGGGGTGGR